MNNLFGATAAGVGGYSYDGNIMTCHLASAAPMVGAFNAATQSGGTIAHHMMSNPGNCIGRDRSGCGSMFTSAGGASFGGSHGDNIRKIFSMARGRMGQSGPLKRTGDGAALSGAPPQKMSLY